MGNHVTFPRHTLDSARHYEDTNVDIKWLQDRSILLTNKFHGDGSNARKWHSSDECAVCHH